MSTGMGLALVAAVRGYKMVFTITDKQSNEKVDLLKAFGAEVVVCPTAVEPDDPRSYYFGGQEVGTRYSQYVLPQSVLKIPRIRKSYVPHHGPRDLGGFWREDHVHFVCGMGKPGERSAGWGSIWKKKKIRR